MNILLLGSGGREHAFAWKISKSKLNKKVLKSDVTKKSVVKLDDVSEIVLVASKHDVDY